MPCIVQWPKLESTNIRTSINFSGYLATGIHTIDKSAWSRNIALNIAGCVHSMDIAGGLHSPCNVSRDRRHAGADRIEVTLAVNETEARLVVRDNGQGFDRRAPGWRPGVGLAAMEERVRGLGGQVTLVSGSGNGTTLTVTLPSRGSDAC